MLIVLLNHWFLHHLAELYYLKVILLKVLSSCIIILFARHDTLNGIENKAYASGGGSSRSKHRDRSRSRSRDRDRKRRRRSRSRSRSFKFKLSIAFTTTLSRSLSLNMELTVVLPFSKVCYTAIFFFKYRVFRTSRTFTFVLL
ncbi:hypothetical protein Y032_0063g3464 [Ancylostoma ceylanicum]|uniref:Uncharacterized protein n=1 Tax=Ancylostoma ceylanicum TaxID=53326 RepID=A0A016U109_9BILA|nr:hypothetical protein Y032_0063g3464 [Ancylostoma ceylanicum]